MNVAINFSIWTANKVGGNEIGIEMYNPLNGLFSSFVGTFFGFGVGLAKSLLDRKHPVRADDPLHER